MTVRINSRLYHDLWNREIDGKINAKLLAVYCTLKYYKKSGLKYFSYTAGNGRYVSGYSLLRARTHLSLASLEKYVPHLIAMGLCHFDKKGNFVMAGGEKTKELYNCYKMVPIKIGSRLVETQYNCFSVKLHSEQRQQLLMINKKQNRRDQIKAKNTTTSLKAYKKAVKLEERYGSDFKIIDKTVLSNQSYAVLKDGEENKKSKGQYWKSKLVERGIVVSTRRFQFYKKMSYNDYKLIRSTFEVAGLVYKDGKLAREIISGFISINIVN